VKVARLPGHVTASITVTSSSACWPSI
jgi:hypothetical protein